MRWIQKTILFFVVVGTMTLLQVLIVVLQTTYTMNQQRQDLEQNQLTEPGYKLPDHISTPGVRGQQQPNLSMYACDEEYDKLLGLPESLKESKCKDCQQFTCKALLFGSSNSSIYTKARKYMQDHPKKIKQDSYFINITHNCDEFKKSRGYHSALPSQMEIEFPIAFNILMHTDVEQVEKLLKAIYQPHNAYCIHIDAKSPKSVQDAMKAITNCFDNVFIASKLEHIVYAGYTRLQADVNCMHDLIMHNIQWKYLMNLAGQSFPLMTNLELVKLFTIYNGMNDFEGMTKRVLHGRIDNEWLEVNGKTLNKTGRKNPKPPHDIEIVRGSAYGIFSREFVQFILTDKKAQDLLRWSQHTWSPDEHYWATLHHTWSNPHLGTPGGYSGYPDSKPWLAVYAAWGGRDKCFGKWKRGVCIFGVGDLPSLLKRHEAFANKFYLDYQPFGLECMESWIEYKSRCPIPFDKDYYENLPFVKSKWKFW